MTMTTLKIVGCHLRCFTVSHDCNTTEAATTAAEEVFAVLSGLSSQLRDAVVRSDTTAARITSLQARAEVAEVGSTGVFDLLV